MTKEILHGREVLLELFPIGAYMKVSALDVKTLTEVSIQGPVNSPEAILKKNALRRLEYVMKKKGLI